VPKRHFVVHGVSTPRPWNDWTLVVHYTFDQDTAGTCLHTYLLRTKLHFSVLHVTTGYLSYDSFIRQAHLHRRLSKTSFHVYSCLYAMSLSSPRDLQPWA
jgi:hypothetical protein